MPKFSETENYVRELFSPDASFSFEGAEYTILETAKPRPESGECKTDVYVKLRNNEGTCRELKISVKQENADFLENKIKYERAKEILGDDVDEILTESISRIRENFEKQYLVVFDKYGRTDAHTVKLGWKFELLNKAGGELSGEVALTPKQVMDVYSGQNLPKDKRDAYVNGKVVVDSGVANYILFVNDTRQYSFDDIVKSLIPIEKYVEEHPRIYYACKALNYRADEDKWDGDRPLSVYVDWTLERGAINGRLVFDEPLKKKGNEVGENLRRIMEEVNVTKDNFDELKEKLSAEVNYYVKE
ncbi:MAG: hypothetical protein IJ183_01675 [Prevotella sp.]|nr:hypothetical protein [Prevotella sp.]